MSAPDFPKQPELVSVVMICGVAGAGRGTALKSLVDMGYHCVDNLPTALLDEYSNYVITEIGDERNPQDNKQFGILLSPTSPDELDQIKSSLKRFKKESISTLLIYLDAQNYVLERRFKETRRPHILQLREDGPDSLEAALELERYILSEARVLADREFDTSFFTPHELRKSIENYFCFGQELSVQLLSFGFKYGSPRNADLMVDVRFLPNPHFVPGLRPSTGLEKPVQDYVGSNGDAARFMELYSELLKFSLPRYESEGKRYLTLGIGCTGGKHRSVTLAEKMAPMIASMGYKVEVRHRDLPKNG